MNLISLDIVMGGPVREDIGALQFMPKETKLKKARVGKGDPGKPRARGAGTKGGGGFRGRINRRAKTIPI